MLKNLWVMRHGLAVDQFDSDFSRELSDFGMLQARDVAMQIKNAPEPHPDTMLVSPFCRTQMTAKIVHQVLSLEKEFVTDDRLVHFADHRLLGDFLLASPYENLIIVSHMPIVAHLCNYLLSSDQIFGFETAQVVHMSIKSNDTEMCYPETIDAKIEKIYQANK